MSLIFTRRSFGYLPDGPDNVLGVEWLLQEHAPSHGPRGYRRKAGRIDDRQIWIMLSAAFGDLPTVDRSGQPDIGDEYVRELPPTPLERFFGGGCMHNIEAFLPEGFHDKFTDERVILHHKNAHGNSSTY
jgi:hypothetical protein